LLAGLLVVPEWHPDWVQVPFSPGAPHTPGLGPYSYAQSKTENAPITTATLAQYSFRPLSITFYNTVPVQLTRAPDVNNAPR
jgi:hypothetical protein